jgi:hypothetical protein
MVTTELARRRQAWRDLCFSLWLLRLAMVSTAKTSIHLLRLAISPGGQSPIE